MRRSPRAQKRARQGIRQLLFDDFRQLPELFFERHSREQPFGAGIDIGLLPVRGSYQEQEGRQHPAHQRGRTVAQIAMRGIVFWQSQTLWQQPDSLSRPGNKDGAEQWPGHGSMETSGGVNRDRTRDRAWSTAAALPRPRPHPADVQHQREIGGTM